MVRKVLTEKIGIVSKRVFALALMSAIVATPSLTSAKKLTHELTIIYTGRVLGELEPCG